MLDFKRIIKEETETCDITTFTTPDGKGSYPYVILPFESRISSKFLSAVTEGMMWMLKSELNRATCILLPEAKGFLLCGIAEKSGIDAVLIRKRNYKVPHQLVIRQNKAYKEKESNMMYCVGLRKTDIPLILDDIVSSGGTLINIVKCLKNLDYEIAGIGTVYERGDGVKRMKKETGYNVKALAKLEILKGKPSISMFYRPL